MLGYTDQKASSQEICGRISESQAILELERTQKATLQMRKTEVNWLAWGHTAIYQQRETGQPRGRESQGSLLRRICQQLVANVLTGDLSPFVRNETEVKLPIRKEHKACKWNPGALLACHAGHGGEGVDGERAAEMILRDPFTSKTQPPRLH